MTKAGKGKTRRSQKTAVPESAPIKPFLKGRVGQLAVLLVVGFGLASATAVLGAGSPAFSMVTVFFTV